MSDPLQLLGAVGSLSGLARPAQPAPENVDGSFGRLLASASRGEVRSGLPVTVDPSVGVELSGADLELLAAAADAAHSAGRMRVLVLMDEASLVLDVNERTVHPAPDLATGMLDDIDGVFGLRTTDAAPASDAALPATISNASVATLLAQMNTNDRESA